MGEQDSHLQAEFAERPVLLADAEAADPSDPDNRIAVEIFQRLIASRVASAPSPANELPAVAAEQKHAPKHER